MLLARHDARLCSLVPLSASPPPEDDGVKTASLSVLLQRQPRPCSSRSLQPTGVSPVRSPATVALAGVVRCTGPNCTLGPSRRPSNSASTSFSRLPSRIKARGIKNVCNSTLNANRKRLHLSTTKSLRLLWEEQHASDQQAISPLCRAPAPKMVLGKVAKILPTPQEPQNTCLEACSRFTINI